MTGRHLADLVAVAWLIFGLVWIIFVLPGCTSFKQSDPRWSDLKSLSDVIDRETQAQKEMDNGR